MKLIRENTEPGRTCMDQMTVEEWRKMWHLGVAVVSPSTSLVYGETFCWRRPQLLEHTLRAFQPRSYKR